jgi:EAL domain-containing protein (putative c-di-GMP-specific phosphodiesterase class I)/CHASE2 domain-containing sensor protein
LRLDFALLERLLARRHAIAVALAVLAGLFALVGGGVGVDRALRDLRDDVRAHDASGELRIVEIDSTSLRAIDQWPWPRRYHARLIDRLHAAQVRAIAFDVDFSSVSNPADDAEMAGALDRAGGGVILATLRQNGGAGRAEIVENVPIPAFRDRSFLAAVNVIADDDGQVRTMLSGLVTDGAPRPSLAAMVAERRAEIGRTFRIDTSIRPGTIPRYSFVDVIEGRVPDTELSGKRIIVGATAIEMGDRYAVPRHGVIPGVVIQAMAAETLLQGPAPQAAGGIWALLVAMGLIIVTVRAGSRTVRAAIFAAGTLAILAVPLAAEQRLAVSPALAPALAALATAAFVALALHLAGHYHRRALTDPQTGLPNRAALEIAAGAGPVVVARIDRFAAIAAGLGPAAVANLVRRVADRIGFGDTHLVYRIDEADLAWIETAEGMGTLPARLEGLVALMRAPIDCGRLVDVSLAFGIADPVDGGARQQVANAALAAVRAERGGTAWLHFVDGESEETDWHLSLLGELDEAMAAGQVWNAYQPKLDIRTGRIVGVEALVRWDHPVRGRIPPDAFIPIVEAHGRIDALTIHVFTNAMADAARWRAADQDVGIAVNVSAALLLEAAFVERLRSLIAKAPMPPRAITIEVTETAAMKEPDRAIAALERWRALGVNISIDDYGTGQSSLGYLQKLPASELKIDMSFVRTLAGDPRNAIMVRSTIAMAHELGLKVVAEGIEDAACLALLADMGCDTAQGWHIGKPMPAADLLASLADQSRHAA